MTLNKAWCSTPKVNALNGFLSKLSLSHAHFMHHGLNHFILDVQIRGEMKVAIMTRLAAKRNMEVYTSHSYTKVFGIADFLVKWRVCMCTQYKSETA